MRQISKVFSGGAMMLALLTAVPAQAAALSSTQVSAIVSLLQSFGADAGVVQSVQATLSGQGTSTGDGRREDNDREDKMRMMMSSSTGMMPPGQLGKMACIALKRDLTLGSKGDDVKELQKMLADDSTTGFQGTIPTGVFGPKTMKAMALFQMKNGIVPTGTGKVGPATRGFFERACGKGEGKDKEQDKGERGMMPQGVVGSITAVGSSTITVSGMNGASKTVVVSATTKIEVVVGTTTPPTTGSMADLVVGKTVTVKGPVGTDGTVAAEHIRVGVLPPMPPMMNTQMGGSQGGMMGAPGMMHGNDR